MHKGTVRPDGEKLRLARLKLKMSRGDVAGKSGYDEKSVQNAEAGKPLRPDTLSSIATAVGLTYDEVVVWPTETREQSQVAAGGIGSAPPLPNLFVGRTEALRELKLRIGVGKAPSSSGSLQVLTAVRGWPGVGKTTMALALAHDPDVSATFGDGILWAWLGQSPDILSELRAWGTAVGAPNILLANTIPQAQAQLVARLKNRRMLLIVDDVWQAEHAVPFFVGGAKCATLITTRLPQVAHELSPTPGDIYRLDPLDAIGAVDLLRILAPSVVKKHPKDCAALVKELEYLPLAIQVAGRLLQAEDSRGLSPARLLSTLREDVGTLLSANAPANMLDVMQQTIPTVAALLRRSTDVLDRETRDRFAVLASFAPKPATFDLRVLAEIWEVSDATPTTRVLTDRGLLEPVGDARFQVHSVLIAHARSLCED